MDTTKVIEAIGEVRTAIGQAEETDLLQLGDVQRFEYFTNKAIAWGTELRT